MTKCWQTNKLELDDCIILFLFKYLQPIPVDFQLISMPVELQKFQFLLTAKNTAVMLNQILPEKNSYFEPRHEKTCLRGFRPSKTQTSLLSYRD